MQTEITRHAKQQKNAAKKQEEKKTAKRKRITDNPDVGFSIQQLQK